MYDSVDLGKQIIIRKKTSTKGWTIEPPIRQVGFRTKESYQLVFNRTGQFHDATRHLIGKRYRCSTAFQHSCDQCFSTCNASRQSDAKRPLSLIYLAHVAKLRTNHGKAYSGGSFGVSLRPVLSIIAVLLLAGIFLWPKLRATLDNIEVKPQSQHSSSDSNEESNLPDEPVHAASSGPGSERLYLPVGPSDQVVHHKYYSLGYDNVWEQARWVAYMLSAQQVRRKGLPRSDEFRPDPAIRDGSADRADYRGSGYSRGHMVPSGDFNYDAEAMAETFLYSNMSPQLEAHNGGVWRELEETVRDWAVKHGEIYIVTGPIVANPPGRTIGANRVAVPEAYYKVILSEQAGAIGFIIPHELQTEPLTAFAKTVDEVEAETGLDFFPELSTIASPAIEAAYQLRGWPTDDQRYHRRLEQWNRQNAR